MAMGRSGFDSSGSRDRPARPQEAPAPESNRPAEPSLLEQALDETLALARGASSLDSAELAPFVEVARRHRGRPLTLEPVAVEMTAAVLRRRFSGLGTTTLEALSRQVAQTLLDDPQARSRLESFWTQLSQSLP